jgi:plastocyanin
LVALETFVKGIILELHIAPGTKVIWHDDTGRHSIEADDGSFSSPAMTTGGQFEHLFGQAGSCPYHCRFHGEKGGKDMAGIVVVTQN